MVKHDSAASSVSSNIFLNHEKYNTLFQAFKETHEETNILAFSKNKLKGLNNWLEDKVNSLEEELKTVKSNFEHLKIIYKAYMCNEVESCKSTKCEKCEVLQEKVNYLMKTVTRISLGIANLNVILGFQNYVFNKVIIVLVFRKNRKSSKAFLTTVKGKLHLL